MSKIEAFNWKKLLRPLAACALAFVAAVLICPLFGRATLNWRDVFFGPPDNMSRDIFFHARWPRVWTAALAGGGLALAGVAFQALLRNPLASPFTLGISAGASLGVIVALHLGWTVLGGGISALPLAAFAGCLLTAALVAFVAGARRQWQTGTLLLAGVIIHFFFSGIIMLLQMRGRDVDVLVAMRWTMGNLTVVDFSPVTQVLVVALPAVVVLWALARPLNLLAAGDESAQSRGVNTRLVKRLVFIAASLLAAAIVSVVGPIGFVGIIVPHAVRMLFGADHRVVIPCSLLAGGAFLVVCDTVGNSVFPPPDIPVGVITAIVGGPFFVWLLRSGGKRMF
jgi:iron complex transport system permease protein